MRTFFQGQLGPRRAALLLLTVGSAQAVFAQTPPDAGSLLQQNEARKPALPPEKKPALRTPDAKPPGAIAGATVMVKAFVLVGNTLIASEPLQALLTPYVGRNLTLGELQAVAGKISDAYAAQGWLARCYLPPQDTTAGSIELRVVEARFSGVRIEGAGRIGAARAERIVLAQQAVDSFVRLPALEHGLMLVDDLAGVRANGALAAGQADGDTELVMTLADTPLLSGDASIDNGGARSTGSTRLSGSLALSSAFGLGEQLSAQLTHSQGSDYARLAATVPVGDRGLRLTLAISGLRYQLTDFSGLDASGNTRGAELELSYPLIRGHRQNLYAQFGLEKRRFDNQANGSTTTLYSSSVANLGLNGNAFDDWAGGGATLGTLGVSQGRINLNASPNVYIDAQSTQTNGDFNVLHYFFSREQRLSSTYSAYLALSGQWSAKNLDSSEKFYLGGPSGVRAYPANEAGGSIGQLLKAEMRATLPPNWSMATFYDWGQITINPHNQFEGAPARNDYLLRGAGVSAAWSGPHALELRGTLAHPLGSSPETRIGHNQDGTRTGLHVWLQASLPF